MALVDDEDYLRLPPGKWHALKGGYAAKRIDGKIILLHRFIMGVVNDHSVQIDHINGGRADCRKENLRKCTPTQNSQNNAGRGKNKFKGIYFEKRTGRWSAGIGINKRKVHLGYFDDCEEAARHYNLRASQEFGEFARFNDVFPLFPISEKVQARVMLKNNTVGWRGVYKHRQRWRAQIQCNEKKHHAFGFESPEAAARAYDEMATRLLGDKAKLNFPPQPPP